MSIILLTALDAYCDGCRRDFGEADDEPATAPGVGHWTSSPRSARADMKTYGWTVELVFKGTHDYCPSCSAQRKAERGGKAEA